MDLSTAALLSFAILSASAVAPSSPAATSASAKAKAETEDFIQDNSNDDPARQWNFSDGSRRTSRPGAANKIALPSKSLSRAPIAPAGAYQGLRLESKQQPPMPLYSVAEGAPVITWVGFQRDTGNQSVVFVQVDRKVEHQVKQKSGRLELFLPGVKVGHANHARSLDLRYFPQIKARSVHTKVLKKGTRIRVRLRKGAAPQVTTRPGPDGQHQILIAL